MREKKVPTEVNYEENWLAKVKNEVKMRKKGPINLNTKGKKCFLKFVLLHKNRKEP